ncbi:MAG: PQQ-binding-like beta-propeller repeat protein [Planctomycetia bacterium]
MQRKMATAAMMLALAAGCGDKPAMKPAPTPATSTSASSIETPKVDTPAPKADAPKTEPPKVDAPTPKKAEPPKSADAGKPAPTATEAVKAVASTDGKKKITGDWTMWGGTVDRNMYSETSPVALDFDPEAPSDKRILWTSKLGSQSYGNPTVAAGKVLVGSNNGGEFRPKHKGDRGCVLCFDEKTGKFLWQLTRAKLAQGRVNDWPEQGICSSAVVEGDRAYVVTNRAELMCLDLNGFHDDENDGPFVDEEDKEKEDADIVWKYDLIEELEVFPHNLATSSPLLYKDKIYIVTGNGVDEAHLKVPSPRSPSFVCVEKYKGELVWEADQPSRDCYSPRPFNNILHGQWSSPVLVMVEGKAQVVFPGGDGWLYSFDADENDDGKGKLIWRFDLNPKDSKAELGGRGDRNEIIGTPVAVGTTVIAAVGQDPEHGEGVGYLYRIDATKKGDVSPTLIEVDAKKNPVKKDGKIVSTPNPNNAQMWVYGGVKKEGDDEELVFRRTISTVSIANGLIFAADLSGFLHCVDLETGKRYWEHDLLAAVWGSPMYADGKILIGDEDGDLEVLEAAKELKVVKTYNFGGSIYSTPVFANGRMFVATRSKIFAINIAD